MKNFLFLMFFTLYFSRCFAESGQPVSFLRTGEIQDVDVEINKIGRGWLALHKTENGWFLSSTKVNLKLVDKNFVDIQSEYKNVEGLIKIKSLIAGKVKPAVLVNDKNGNSIKFKFSNKSYNLNVRKIQTVNKVYFSDGAKETLIEDGYEEQSCASPSIVWAGDIDRDNKPDIIVYFSDDDEKYASVCVYLSTLAKKNKLLGLGGCQFFSG